MIPPPAGGWADLSHPFRVTFLSWFDSLSRSLLLETRYSVVESATAFPTPSERKLDANAQRLPVIAEAAKVIPPARPIPVPADPSHA